MVLVISYGSLGLLAIAAPTIEWLRRRRIEQSRHKAQYPLVDQYSLPQASAMAKWPWV
jgi:hypothetical protein